MQENRKFNYPVNGLRGLCVLLVFVFHVQNSGIFPDVAVPGVLFYLHSCCYGVEMFFMISGYVITGSLRRHGRLPPFFRDRALRIFPTWLPPYILTFISAPLFGRSPIPAGADLWHWIGYFLAALVFLPTVFPVPLIHPAAWTLSYEWCFYMIAGAVFVLLGRGRRYWPVIAGLLALAGYIVASNLRALFFLPGIIAYGFEKRLAAYARYCRFPLLGLVVFLTAWGSLDSPYGLQDPGLGLRLSLTLLALLAGVYMFAGIALGQGWLSRILATKFFQFFGRISYGLYLWSPICFYPAKRLATALILPRSGPWTAVIAFAVLAFIPALIVAWLNHLLIERKLTGWLKRRFAVSRSLPSGSLS